MEIPHHQWDSEEAANRIRLGQPVVLMNCLLSQAVSDTWTFEYLKDLIQPDFKNDVYISKNMKFQYWDEAKNQFHYRFKPPTTKRGLTFVEFLDIIRNSSSTSNSSPLLTSSTNSPDNSGAEDSSPKNRFYYLQQSMVQDMGPRMMAEYMRFPLDYALRFKKIGNWDELTTNLLLCGMEGYVTPLHFDEQQNLFAQLHGVKRIRLFSSSDWPKLYTYPLGHPCDRQSRVQLPSSPGCTVFDDPVLIDSFPLFGSCPSTEYFVDLMPGEILYIPQYWFHQMEGLTENISMSWWFKDSVKGIDPNNIDFNKVSFVAIRRNVEKLVSSMLGGGREPRDFFLALAAGKIPIPEVDAKGISCTALALPLEVDIAAARDITPKPEWTGIVAQAIHFATIVLPPGEAPAFVQGISVGRYQGL